MPPSSESKAGTYSVVPFGLSSASTSVGVRSMRTLSTGVGLSATGNRLVEASRTASYWEP